MNSRATEVAPGSNPLDPIRTLCLGDAGTAVANLQQFLIDGDGSALSVTSYFGWLTPRQ